MEQLDLQLPQCNGENKKDKWPPSGYVDPSAEDEQDHPQRYFDYDSSTGEIIARPGLSAEARKRAQDTIDDLGLNKVDVRNNRLDWTRRFAEDWRSLSAGDRHAFAEFSIRLGVEFAGAALMVVQQLQLSEDM